MISNQTIKSSIDKLKSITKIDFSVWDLEGYIVASTQTRESVGSETVIQFAQSPADSQELQGFHFFKVRGEEDPEYILIARGVGEDVHMVGRIAVSQLQDLIVAYRERFDRNNFVQNLLLDNLLLVDIYNRAKKLHRSFISSHSSDELSLSLRQSMSVIIPQWKSSAVCSAAKRAI